MFIYINNNIIISINFKYKGYELRKIGIFFSIGEINCLFIDLSLRKLEIFYEEFFF